MRSTSQYSIWSVAWLTGGQRSTCPPPGSSVQKGAKQPHLKYFTNNDHKNYIDVVQVGSKFASCHFADLRKKTKKFKQRKSYQHCGVGGSTQSQPKLDRWRQTHVKTFGGGEHFIAFSPAAEKRKVGNPSHATDYGVVVSLPISVIIVNMHGIGLLLLLLLWD